ncbi:(S)-1-phenylethanol dehydrogenase [mine drainage metagenome]|uniref:(S)-1-phenylethanol dehydrogenase n=1 Tax=mine drainage metagenome TaxID=410659 RepID=A0A1J5RPA0_9ZZZZ
MRGLLEAGAAKVYAASRNPGDADMPGVVPVRLDVTQPARVAALAEELRDVQLLVNNAGILEGGALLQEGSADSLQRQFETNAVGPLRLVQAFAPVLARNGGGVVLNVVSVLSWLTLPGTGAYSASKAAAWALGNALRGELKAQGTQLLAVHCALLDTDMSRGMQGDKLAPEALVAQCLTALQEGQSELLADATTRNVHAGLAAQSPVYLGLLAPM